MQTQISGLAGARIVLVLLTYSYWTRYSLYHAARTGCVESVDLLLEYGAAEMSKACLLNAAVQSGYTEMVEPVLPFAGSRCEQVGWSASD